MTIMKDIKKGKAENISKVFYFCGNPLKKLLKFLLAQIFSKYVTPVALEGAVPSTPENQVNFKIPFVDQWSP